MIELVVGDITEQEVDAIVNAANATLLGGGGVDGAIHRAGGPSILEECKQLGGCRPGEVKATTAGNLPARHVLHAVGPMWRGGTESEAELLASCHRRAIELASELGDRSVAFPAISTGAYGYPVELAAPVAIEATQKAMHERPDVQVARFVFRDERTLAPYREALGGT
jgi:O-acetyl-ADP-ribose deacetylase (regulator of RNase III)